LNNNIEHEKEPTKVQNCSKYDEMID